LQQSVHWGHARVRVAVIEDDAAVRRVLGRILEDAGYGVIAVGDGEAGLRAVAEHQPDMLILDLTLPGVDGLEICRRLRTDSRTVTLPIIVLTAHTSTSDMVAALDAGADDFVTKPFQQVELLARLRSSFRTREVIRRMEQAHDIVVALANAVEAKDLGLKDHCRYLAYRSARLAAYLGLRDGELEGVAYGALLHDIGKIGIAEHVLHKPGPLTEEEFRVMREHPEIGERICDPLRMSRDFTPIIRHHHERWDGSGYPDGLRGEDIPLGARIVALADAFDAIVRGRPYRPARSVDEAFHELRVHAGKQFDPALVPLFIEEADRDHAGIAPSVELPRVALLSHEDPSGARAATGDATARVA
jgi:putative two-component system response regulator